MKKIKDNTAFLGLPSEAHDIIRILSEAKSRNTDAELETRYWDAIQAIGLKWLEHVESQYEPEKRTFRVNIEGSRSVEVEASNATEALEIVDSSDDSARSHECYGAVEEVK